MPATIRHPLVMTTPDDPAYENQPQHWNQTHAVTIDAVGSEVFGAFNNGGNVKFGLAAGSISASAGINFSAGTLSQNRSDFTFGNANGLSFGLETNGVITGSYTVPSIAGLLSAINVSAGTTSNNLSNLVFDNANGLTFGLNGSTITASHNGITNIKVSAGTLSANRSDITFSNANGVSFGLETNGVITASVAAGGGAAIRGIAAGGSTATENTVNFSNSNGVSFGFGAGANSTVITASHNGLTSQSNQALSGSNGSFTFQTATFGNLNGLSFYTSNGSLVGSYTVPSQTVQPVAISGSNGSFAFSTVTFGNLNGLSFYTSNGSMVGSYTVPSQTVQPVAVSGSNGSFVFSTLSMGSSNGMHFYTTNGSIVGSYTVPVQSNQTLGLYAVGNTTGQSSSSTFDARTISFNGAGVASVGYSAGSVIISVPAGGGGLTNIKVSAGTLSANRSDITFGDSNGVSFGLETNGVVTASVNAGGGGGTATMWYPYNEAVNVARPILNATMHIAPVPTPVNAAGGELHIDRICFPMLFSGATNSTGSYTISYRIGLYTRNGSTISLAHSTSFTIGVTHSGTANSVSNSGIRLYSAGWTTTITEARYLVAVNVRTSSAGANASFSHIALSGLASNFSGYPMQATNRSNQWPLGLGFYSASTTGIPSSIAYSQIDGSHSAVARPPSWFAVSQSA